MKDKPKVAAVGGDARQIAVVDGLRAMGIQVTEFGTYSAHGCKDDAKTLEESVAGKDAVILGAPFSRDGKYINCPKGGYTVALDALCEMMTPRGLLLGGRVDGGAAAAAAKYGVKFIDYMAAPEVAVENAVPTAEGAIAEAMNALDITLFGAKVLVTGGGRVSAALVPRLLALGAHVTVMARRTEQRAYFYGMGAETIGFGDRSAFGGFDVIFNTVPAQIIDETALENAYNATIIDLASLPGGVDDAAAKRRGIRIIHALSLPGKVAPKTAGVIVLKSIVNILRAEGVIE